MANTYTQLLVHIVFAVHKRQNLIWEKHRESLEKYICGIITKKGCKPLAIFCNPDHVHILIGLNPSLALSDLVRDIKSNSTNWINERAWFPGKFSWQKGFGAFSNSKSQLDQVVKYILNQPHHHKKKSFKEEYLEFLNESKIKYNEKYLFDFME